MKKIYLLLVLFAVMFSLTSCKNKYEISDNAYLLEYNELCAYGFSYVNSEGDKEYYYKVPLNVVVGVITNVTSRSTFIVSYSNTIFNPHLLRSSIYSSF